ncbi:MAG: ABC transporter permease [Bacteroidota bacterium]
MSLTLIAQTEYKRRIRSKWFILTTLLAPVLLAAMFVLPIFFFVLLDEAETTPIALVDETGRLASAVEESLGGGFEVTIADAGLPLDSLRADLLAGDVAAYVVLPVGLLAGEADAVLYNQGGGGISQQGDLRRAIRDAVEAERLRAAGLSEEVMADLDRGVGFTVRTVSEEGESADMTGASFMVGYAMGSFMFFVVYFYGLMVLRGVIEEKANRIVEVMASSVRPFDLIVGKVLGIGAIGLTQLVAWAVLILGGLFALGSLLPLFIDPATVAAAQDPEAAGQAAEALPFDVEAFGQLFSPVLFLTLGVYFLGGFVLYAALMAAVGAAVDQESDAQSLMVPLIMPLVVTPLLVLMPILNAPNAPFALGMSLVPPFAPILMVARHVVTDVPWWQHTLGIALLGATALGLLWVAARIYRTGMLMYGKKASFKELWQWARAS